MVHALPDLTTMCLPEGVWYNPRHLSLQFNLSHDKVLGNKI